MTGTTWVRLRPYTARLGVLALAAALVACSDDSSPLGPPDPGPNPRPDGEQQELGVTPVVPRVDLDFAVNGAFRPGLPIIVTAIARGRRQADQVNLELVVHDEASAATTPGESAGWNRVGTFRGALGRGSEHRLAQSITFPAAGYYRVSARVMSSGPTPDRVAPGDSLILDTSYRTLYILVDENGGRVTDGFEPSARGSRLPQFGSYGPFVPGRSGTAARAVSPVGGPSLQTSRTYTYYFEYDNQDTGTRRPVQGAQVEIECLNTSYAVYSTLYPVINADGSFTFTCPYGYFNGSIRLFDIYSEVLGEGRAPAGVDYFWEGTAQRLVAANQYAAHVFVTLRQYVPTAETRFGNRWRNRLPVLVSATNSGFGIHYDQNVDTMRTNYSRVFGQDGRFVTMHEYGHAYHWGAIERWANYNCNSPQHYTDVAYTLSCAFVEGFATFFAVWLAGNELTTGQLTDNGIETQTFYNNGDGVLIEGSVAGFLYDLVDGTGQRDNTANSGAFEETWDTAVYPGSLIADMMSACAPYTLSNGVYSYTYYLDGADQLVYCMEGNVSAETYARTWSTNWRTTWDGVERTFTLPTGYSTTLVRTLWKRNLYGAA